MTKLALDLDEVPLLRPGLGSGLIMHGRCFFRLSNSARARLRSKCLLKILLLAGADAGDSGGLSTITIGRCGVVRGTRASNAT